MPLSAWLTSELQLRRPVCWLWCCTWCNLVRGVHARTHERKQRNLRALKLTFLNCPQIKKLSSFESSEPDWSWVLNLTKVETAACGHKSDWQASLWRGALWYLRWWLDRQIIILPIRVPFFALWSLQRVMACSCRSASGCLRSHYPTGSSAVINDKRPEYWFVNLQSGAIRCSLQNDRNLPSEGGLSLRILTLTCIWLQVALAAWF